LDISISPICVTSHISTMHKQIMHRNTAAAAAIRSGFRLPVPGASFGLAPDIFGLAVDIFGLLPDTFGLAADTFGLALDIFGLEPVAFGVGLDLLGVVLGAFGLGLVGFCLDLVIGVLLGVRRDRGAMAAWPRSRSLVGHQSSLSVSMAVCNRERREFRA
jgi:hypothetical protein